MKIIITIKPKKVVQLNKYTKAICLPAIWCKHHNLTKENLLEISFGEDDSLIIKPIKKIENNTGEKNG